MESNKMYEYTDIKRVHLEVTERCQAACPMCIRNQNDGSLNPHLGLSELTLDDCKNIFPPDFIKQLRAIFMCGNFGDPIIAQDSLEIYEYFRRHNPTMWLGMNTNAGARDSEWWIALAKIIGSSGMVNFSLDGLKDTNHIYRRNVNWDKCMQSAEAFIGAGGEAWWDFIIFEHNEHQIDEAEKLASDMGFKKFTKKKTSRPFSSQKNYIINQKNGKTIFLSPPNNLENQYSGTIKKQLLIEKYGNMDNYYDEVSIKCKVKGEEKIFITAEGLLLPCCWTAGRMYNPWAKNAQADQIWEFINNNGGKQSIDTKIHGIQNVMESGILQDIEKSWSVNSCKNGKLKICSMTCGADFDFFKEQFK